MANLNTSSNLTFSYNELTDSIVSRHSYKMPVTTVDSKNFVATSYDEIYLQNRGEYGVFFGVRHSWYITLMLNAKAPMAKNFYHFEYKLLVDQLDGTNVEDVNLTRYRAYNEYQDTGYITLATDNRRTHKKFRTYATQLARNINSRNQLQRLCNDYIYLTLEYYNLPVNGKYLQTKLHPLVYSYALATN